MKNYYLRTKNIANYIVQNKTTIRQTAKAFGMAKSTVHFDIQNRLPFVDALLYKKVQEILDENFSEKSIRGGLATKRMYQLKNMRRSINKKWANAHFFYFNLSNNPFRSGCINALKICSLTCGTSLLILSIKFLIYSRFVWRSAGHTLSSTGKFFA